MPPPNGDGLNEERSDPCNGSPLWTGPLKGSSPTPKKVTFDWVARYNNERLHSFSRDLPPEESG
jgi:hypothetical protein